MMTEYNEIKCLNGNWKKVLFLWFMLFLLLGAIYLSNQMIKQQVMTQQTIILGIVYEKDAMFCKELLLELFQLETNYEIPAVDEPQVQTKEEKIAIGKQALLTFAYTEEGLEYLYRQSSLQKSQNKVFLFQVILLLMLGFLCWKVEQRHQEEEDRFLRDIGNFKSTLEDLGEKYKMEHYSFCSKRLLEEFFNLSKETKLAQVETENVRQMAQNFVENVAHQIKTPLACISISLDLLLENLQEEAEKNVVQETFVYLKQIEILMKKLLSIGRLESGKLLMKKEAVSLEEILRECMYLLDLQGRTILLKIYEDREEELPIFYGDYEWLKEAFSNILKNCMEHTEHQVKTHIEMELSYQKDMIYLQIRDHGSGITDKDLKHIFDRFYLPEKVKSNHTGIGLNLAKLVIEKHFGTIKVCNHKEGGAVFSILFPIYRMKHEKI